MTQLTLDSPIVDLNISNKALNSFLRRNITTIGLMLAHSQDQLLKIRTLGLRNLEIITKKVHQSGLVFIDESGYEKQLEKAVKKKLGITSLPLNEIDDILRKKILDLQIYEFTALISDNCRPIFNNYPFKHLKVKDIVCVNLRPTGNKEKDRKCISSPEAIYYVNAICKSGPGKEEDIKNIWINVIHSFGFLYKDEDGYDELMEKIENSDKYKIELYQTEDVDITKFMPINELNKNELELRYNNLKERLKIARINKEKLLKEIGKMDEQIAILEHECEILTNGDSINGRK